jgi:drug/metabolite transporter (DMT)-like permease
MRSFNQPRNPYSAASSPSSAHTGSQNAHAGSQSHAGAQSAQEQLKAVSQSLKTLQDGLVAQLLEDVEWLKTEKVTLQQEIQELRHNKQQLLSQQQLGQQQQWAKQFAQILAQHLQQELRKELSHNSGQGSQTQGGTIENHQVKQIHQLLISLDSALTGALRTLQQEISNYHSTLHQQLIEMHSQDRQAEVILETLIKRLSQQLASQNRSRSVSAGESSSPIAPSSPVIPPESSYRSTPLASEPVSRFSGGDATGTTPQTATAPRASASNRRSNATPVQAQRWGLILATLSVLTLALQYLLAEALFQKQNAPVFWGITQSFDPTWNNTLLALWLRTLVVIPLIAFIGSGFYPNLWRDLRSLPQGPARQSFFPLAFSGLLWFLSQWFLYRAVGETSAGIAMTLFFVHPAILTLFVWGLMGDRPSPFKTYGMITLGVGAISILSLATDANHVNGAGLLMGLLSGTTFALYLLMTGFCSRKLHPLVITIVQFTVAFVLATTTWFFPSQIPPDQFQSFVVGGLLLGGAATLCYLFNTLSIYCIGAIVPGIVSHTAPILTVILSVLILKEAVGFYQSIGVVLVTFGAVALGLDRFRGTKK